MQLQILQFLDITLKFYNSTNNLVAWTAIYASDKSKGFDHPIWKLLDIIAKVVCTNVFYAIFPYDIWSFFSGWETLYLQQAPAPSMAENIRNAQL